MLAQLVKNLPAIRRPQFNYWVSKICWRRDRLPTAVFWPGELHGLFHGVTRVGPKLGLPDAKTLMLGKIENRRIRG